MLRTSVHSRKISRTVPSPAMRYREFSPEAGRDERGDELERESSRESADEEAEWSAVGTSSADLSFFSPASLLALSAFTVDADRLARAAAEAPPALRPPFQLRRRVGELVPA